MEGEVPPRVGKNAKRNSEWLPPEPPQDDDAHTYVFQLFAVDERLALRPGASLNDVVAAIDGHVLGVAMLAGTYSRENWDDEDEDGDEV